MTVDEIINDIFRTHKGLSDAECQEISNECSVLDPGAAAQGKVHLSPEDEKEFRKIMLNVINLPKGEIFKLLNKIQAMERQRSAVN